MSDELKIVKEDDEDIDKLMLTTATLRMSKEEKEEYKSLPTEVKKNIKTALDFYKWKLRNSNKKDVDALSGNIVNLTNSMKGNPSTEEIRRQIQMEFDLKKALEDNQKLQQQSLQGLSEVPVLVEKQVSQRMHDMEFAQLKIDKANLELDVRKKDLDIQEISSKLADAEGKLKALEVVKELTPHLGPLAKLIAAGAKGAKGGGGLMGFLEAAGESGAEFSGGASKLSEEDELSLEFGQKFYSMFPIEQERNSMIMIISLLAENRPSIPVILKAVSDMAESNQ